MVSISSDRLERKWANRPLLVVPKSWAKRPIVIPSSPSFAAICIACARIFLRVTVPFETCALLADFLACKLLIINDNSTIVRTFRSFCLLLRIVSKSPFREKHLEYLLHTQYKEYFRQIAQHLWRTQIRVLAVAYDVRFVHDAFQSDSLSGYFDIPASVARTVSLSHKSLCAIHCKPFPGWSAQGIADALLQSGFEVFEHSCSLLLEGIRVVPLSAWADFLEAIRQFLGSQQF